MSESLDPDSTPRVPADLGKRAFAGAAWNYIAFTVGAVGHVAYTVAMSRLVSPAAFGLVAMTVVSGGVGTLLSRLGIGQALIQKPNLSDTDVRACFTLSLLSGIFFFGLSWLFAPALAGLFNEPKAVSVIRGSSFYFVTLGLSATSESLMRRHLRNKELALIHIAGFLIGYFVIGVGSAVAGAGVWALVFAPISHKLIEAIIAYPRIRHPVRPTLDRNSYRALLSYGSRLSLISLGEFFGSQTDTIIVGRYAGASLLGMYNRAFYLAVVPLQMLMNTMGSVLFASFSRLQTDLPRLARAYLSSVKVTAALFMPVSAAIGVASYELIVVLLGERYRASAAIVPFFAVYASMNKMSQLCGLLCDARAELNKRFALQAAYIVGLVVALLAVAGGPLWAYGAVLAGGEVTRNFAYNLLIIRWIIPVDLSELFKPYIPGLTAAALVIGPVFATRTLLVEAIGLPAIVTLMAEGAVAGTVLLLLMRRGPLSFLPKEIVARYRVDRAGADERRFLNLVLRLLFGSSVKAQEER